MVETQDANKKTGYITLFRCPWWSIGYQIYGIRVGVASGIRGKILGSFNMSQLVIARSTYDDLIITRNKLFWKEYVVSLLVSFGVRESFRE